MLCGVFEGFPFVMGLGKMSETGGVGVSLDFTQMWGVCCFESRIAKLGGVSTYFIKYGLIIEYISYHFAFLGWVHKIFLSKISPSKSGQHPAPEGHKIGPPPPLGCF